MGIGASLDAVRRGLAVGDILVQLGLAGLARQRLVRIGGAQIAIGPSRRSGLHRLLGQFLLGDGSVDSGPVLPSAALPAGLFSPRVSSTSSRLGTKAPPSSGSRTSWSGSTPSSARPSASARSSSPCSGSTSGIGISAPITPPASSYPSAPSSMSGGSNSTPMRSL